MQNYQKKRKNSIFVYQKNEYAIRFQHIDN